MSLNLKNRFIIIGLLSIVSIAFSVYQNYKTDKIVADLSDTQSLASGALQRHMDADMKHDGIRGNVYSALFASKTGDAELLKSSKEEVADMAKGFVKDIDENIAANLPQDIHAQFAKIKGAVVAYAEASNSIVEASSDFERANAMLPKFNQAFSFLEEEQGAATDMLINGQSH